MPTVKADTLRMLGTEILKAAGAPDDEAKLVAELLVEANLTGHDSHGVIRMLNYVKGMRMGAVRPGAKITIIRETSSTAVIDGGWGFGQVVAMKAMEVAIEKAKKCSISAVTVRRCHHVGRLNTYSEMALNYDMIGITMVNSNSYVAPFGGRTRQLGTNPMCFAIPAGEEGPFVLDMATAVWAQGKIMVKAARGERLPEGVLLDIEGNPTTDATWYEKGGAILPIGGLVGYKGFGLSLLVELLAGALSEAGCSNSEEYQSRPFYGGNGVFMMAIDIRSFTDIDSFKRRADNLFKTIKSSPLAKGYIEILIPGEVERRRRERNLREGIFIEDSTWSKLLATAKELGVDV
ncbi:MAG: Ldh family oxidoreductase [Candidatus Bathyarchaeia archaeon]